MNILSSPEAVEASLKEFNEGLALDPSAEFPERVNTRLAVVDSIARGNASKIDRTQLKPVNLFLKQVGSGKTRTSRFIWLQRAADAFAKEIGKHAACHQGCTHCCYTPVTLSEAEAVFIGKSISVSPVASAERIKRTASYTDPCPFLKDNACSIYEHRPTVCRTHFNLDSDSLLCELVDGAAIPVPYMDARVFTAHTLKISGGTDTKLADIREWFPHGL